MPGTIMELYFSLYVGCYDYMVHSHLLFMLLNVVIGTIIATSRIHKNNNNHRELKRNQY